MRRVSWSRRWACRRSSKSWGPQLPIRFVAAQPMKGPDHDCMSERDDGPFLPPAGGQAVREGRPVGPLRAGRRMGPLRQPRTHGLLALAGLPRALFPGARMVARGDAAPGCSAGGRAEAPHVDAPLGHPPLPAPLIAPGNRVQERDGPGEGQGGVRRFRGGGAARLVPGPWRRNG